MRELARPGCDARWFAVPAADEPFHDPSLLTRLWAQPDGDPGGDRRLSERPGGDTGDQVTGRGGGPEVEAEALPSEVLQRRQQRDLPVVSRQRAMPDQRSQQRGRRLLDRFTVSVL